VRPRECADYHSVFTTSDGESSFRRGICLHDAHSSSYISFFCSSEQHSTPRLRSSVCCRVSFDLNPSILAIFRNPAPSLLTYRGVPKTDRFGSVCCLKFLLTRTILAAHHQSICSRLTYMISNEHVFHPGVSLTHTTAPYKILQRHLSGWLPLLSIYG
jgi:hypothetical protein